MAWLYRSRVMATSLWPSTSDTILGLVPAAIPVTHDPEVGAACDRIVRLPCPWHRQEPSPAVQNSAHCLPPLASAACLVRVEGEWQRTDAHPHTALLVAVPVIDRKQLHCFGEPSQLVAPPRFEADVRPFGQ